jgi:hypothetical protein
MAIPFVRSAQAIASLRGSSLLCNMQVLCLKFHNSLLHTRVNLACPAHQAFKPSKSSPRLRRHAPRAADKGKSSKGGLDWDSAWSNFKDGLNKNIPVVEDRTAQRPESQQQPKSSNKSPQFARDSRRQLRENIKKQENLVLDFWSQELFFKAGGVFIAVLLVIFLLIGGPGGPD